MSDLDTQAFLYDLFNVDLRIGAQNKYVLFFCCFLFLAAFLRFLFWKISPVIYEIAMIGIFYGLGKLLHAADTSSVLETAEDLVSRSCVHFLIPIYVFTATFEFNTSFGSYGWMFMLLASLVPFFVLNLFFISWIMYAVFEKNFLIGFLEMLMITVILSPVQVQFILDYLEHAQGCTAEFKFKMRAEQYSSIWLSFVIFSILHRISLLSKTGQFSSILIFLFIVYQLVGILVGFIFSRFVTFPLKKAIEMPAIYTVTITLTAVYLVQTSCVMLGTSHTLAVGIFGIALNAQISRSGKEITEFFHEYWMHLLFLVNSMTVALIGAVLGFAAHDTSSITIRVVFIFYCVFIATRLVLLLIAFPIVTLAMRRLVDWRYAIIQVVGTYKGGPSYILGFQYAMMISRNWYVVLQITVIYTMISQICNVLMFPMLLRMLRMYDYSAARIANMNIAMADTNNCREKAIFALKMDKVFRDANWPVVETFTRLSHPYKKNQTQDMRNDEGKDDHQIRSVICPDCKLEILAQPTKREIDAMKREARERIIKSQAVSFHKQYEMGSLTVREYDYLSTIVEAEVNQLEPKLHPEKMKFRSNFTKVLIQIKRMLLWFSKLTAEVYHFIPQSTIRNWCYQISTSRQLRIIMALLTLTDTALTIGQVIVYYTAYYPEEGSPGWNYSPTNWSFGSTVQKLHIFFYSMSLLEFAILTLGLGLDQYFSRNVNKIEASTGIILGTLEILIYTENCLKAGKSLHPFLIPIIMMIKATTPLRLAKIYILIIAAVPKIIASIDASLGDEMMRNYELGKAYLVALNRTSALLNRIVYSEAVYTELMKEIDADRMHVTKEMGLIQKENPSIATTVKTRHAIRYVINSMEDCIKDMKEEGVIDMIEAEAVQDSLIRNKNILRELLMISATPPEEILKNIPWLKDDSENLIFLLQNAELTSYDYGDVLIHAGDDPVGIHLLVSGLLRSHYIPSTTTLQLNSKFGVLPNYDFFNNMKFDQPQESYVVSGSIIGEIGAVSGRRYDMTINCDTAVQVYYIPWEIIKLVVHENEGSTVIMSKIWKAISIKISVNILLYNVVTFQGWAPEKLLLFLNKGFVPIIPGMIAVTITTKVEIIILIEGLVMDKYSRTVYTGPVFIPKNMHEIILPEHPDWEYSTMIETRMLIIPSNISNEEELRGPNGIFKFRQKERTKDDESPHRKVGFDVETKEILTKSENNINSTSKIL
ncbi:hypothetical protein GE061_002127 [Apolygus lucorum]|uniref:Cyclic nucleotide-binding domain-containing protein n=1 Tax=Apolygus lucorum TaxID=248454 RepID=A0A8S9X471_APOLU|nr:hypothetical protein GE061_002127 [Apolygus lucorum]